MVPNPQPTPPARDTAPEWIYEELKRREKYYYSSLSAAFRVVDDPRMDIPKAVRQGFAYALDTIQWSTVQGSPLVELQDLMLDHVSLAAEQLKRSRKRKVWFYSLTLMLGLETTDAEFHRGLAAVDALSPERAAVYHCRVLFGMSIRQTGWLLRKSEVTVTTTLHKARKDMRDTHGVDSKTFERQLVATMREEQE